MRTLLIPSTEIYEQRSPEIHIDFQDASEINTDYLSKTKISEPDITDQDLLRIQAATDISPFNLVIPDFEENIESDNSDSEFYDYGIPEMNIFLIKVAGSCFVAALSSLILLLNLPIDIIYFFIMNVMIFHFIIDYQLKCELLGELMHDNEDLYRMIDEFLIAVATLFMYLKYRDVLSFSTLAISLLVTSLLTNLLINKMPKRKKLLAIILRIGYVLQSSLISFRFDQYILCNWNFVFIPTWIYLLILIIQQIKKIIFLYKKINKRGPSEEFSKKIGFAWYIGYSGSALVAFISLFGISDILNDQSNRRTLVVITIITTTVFSALFIATIAFRRHLVPFLLSYNLVTSHLLNYYASLPPEPVKQIEFETQNKEKFFVMVSSTYFQPLHEALNEIKGSIKAKRSSVGGERTQKYVGTCPKSNSVSIKTHENCQQEERKEAESQCYLCYSNPADAILMGCGHGGICYDCAITSVKKKDECMECRTKVEGIYKIDLELRMLNTVKGIQYTKVVVKET